MNRDDLKLHRLFAAARHADDTPCEAMPPHLATRILYRWRSGATKEDSLQMIGLLFRRALVCASMVMLFTLMWSYDALSDDAESDEAYANYELRTDIMP